MEIRENYPLQDLNTFNIAVSARHYVAIRSEEELLQIIKDPQWAGIPKLLLGGGSNILFTRDFEGLVIKNELTGISREKEDDNHVWIRAASGEVWHELVMYSIQHNLGGIENLSLIPGSVGAAPIQNIGAYGVELEEVFDRLEAIHMVTGERKVFDRDDCRFGYRNSIFKQALKGQYCITAVILRLDKQPRFNTSYGAIRETLEAMQVQDLSVKAVSDAVIAIRRKKLPDPAEIGNSGSFFKNPVLDSVRFRQLKAAYPDIPHYELPDDAFKIPAAWLIEKCGWKGKQVGQTGTHKHQPLVLVNHGRAEGKEVEALARAIRQSVADKFGIELVPEVNII